MGQKLQGFWRSPRFFPFYLTLFLFYNNSGKNRNYFCNEIPKCSELGEKKCICLFTPLPKGVVTKYLKLFWLEIFSICHWSCENLREFSKKIETALMGYSGAWGNWFMKNTWSRKSHGSSRLNLSLRREVVSGDGYFSQPKIRFFMCADGLKMFPSLLF